MVVRGFKEAFHIPPATDAGILWNMVNILVPPKL